MSWREDAACKGMTDLFFAGDSERPEAAARREAEAARLCDICPVRGECQGEAERFEVWGFWAGESEVDRALRGVFPRETGWPGHRREDVVRVMSGVLGGVPRSSARKYLVGSESHAPARFGDGPGFSWGWADEGEGRVTPLGWRERRARVR